MTTLVKGSVTPGVQALPAKAHVIKYARDRAVYHRALIVEV